MTSRRIEVFFYGLFMDADLLRAKGADPVNIRPACVRGFALRIGKRATLLRTSNATAYGIVMELTHAELDQLYSDPSVSAYRPESVLAELTDGSHVPALCFNLPVPPDPEETNSEYAAKLRDVARRLGLPANYSRKAPLPRGFSASAPRRIRDPHLTKNSRPHHAEFETSP